MLEPVIGVPGAENVVGFSGVYSWEDLGSRMFSFLTGLGLEGRDVWNLLDLGEQLRFAVVNLLMLPWCRVGQFE